MHGDLVTGVALRQNEAAYSTGQVSICPNKPFGLLPDRFPQLITDFIFNHE